MKRSINFLIFLNKCVQHNVQQIGGETGRKVGAELGCKVGREAGYNVGHAEAMKMFKIGISKERVMALKVCPSA